MADAQFILARLTSALEAEALLPAVFRHSGDDATITHALSERELPAFEQPWLAAFAAVESVAPLNSLSPAHRLVVDRIRELAYKSAFRATSHPDIAAYVSDDFDLIARAIVARQDSPWLASLLSAYLHGRFPVASSLVPARASLSIVASALPTHS
jgi:hypothetical protein